MKMLIPAKVNKIKKNDVLIGQYNMFSIPFKIDEIGLNVNMELAKRDMSDSADSFNIELFSGCAEFTKGAKVSLTIGNEVKELDSKMLALIVSDLFIDALVRASETGMPFKLDVSLPSNKKSELEKEQKELIKLSKRLKAEKTNTVEINAEMIMNTLNRIESKLQHDQIASPTVVTNKVTTIAVNADGSTDLTSEGYKKPKRVTLDL